MEMLWRQPLWIFCVLTSDIKFCRTLPRMQNLFDLACWVMQTHFRGFCLTSPTMLALTPTGQTPNVGVMLTPKYINDIYTFRYREGTTGWIHVPSVPTGKPNLRQDSITCSPHASPSHGKGVHNDTHGLFGIIVNFLEVCGYFSFCSVTEWMSISSLGGKTSITITVYPFPRYWRVFCFFFVFSFSWRSWLISVSVFQVSKRAWLGGRQWILMFYLF